MNLKEAKDRAIKLINEYSNNGSLIVSTANADYLLRMNALADDAHRQLANAVGIDAVFNFTQTAVSGSTKLSKTALPSLFKSIRFVRLDDSPYYRYSVENGQFLVPQYMGGSFDVTYDRYPTEITDTTDDSFEFEVNREAQDLIPYYLAGMVITDENGAISDKLLNMFFSRLAALNRPTEWGGDRDPVSIFRSAAAE